MVMCVKNIFLLMSLMVLSNAIFAAEKNTVTIAAGDLVLTKFTEVPESNAASATLVSVNSGKPVSSKLAVITVVVRHEDSKDRSLQQGRRVVLLEIWTHSSLPEGSYHLFLNNRYGKRLTYRDGKKLAPKTIQIVSSSQGVSSDKKGVTVSVNNMGVVDNAASKYVASFPDTCFMPRPPAPQVPVPYPVIGVSNDQSTTKTPTKQAGVPCKKTNTPVCGKDGNTYTNKCFAQQAGVDVMYQGKCKTKIPVQIERHNDRIKLK